MRHGRTPTRRAPAHAHASVSKGAASRDSRRGPLRHFCYPSGRWSPEHADVFAQAGVASAVTCEPGFVRPDHAPYELPRILDGENLAQVEFEAELSGFSAFLRRAKRLVLRT